jgi:hypothetical protein
MTKQFVCRWWMMSVTALWMGGCSHTPSVGDIPPTATFTTKILADDTKLFVYSQRFGRRGKGSTEADDLADTSGRSAGFGDSSGRIAQVKQAALRGVQAMLAQNHYCRDRYVILEQYDQHGSYIIRGECRDAANSAERSKFSQ